MPGRRVTLGNVPAAFAITDRITGRACGRQPALETPDGKREQGDNTYYGG